MSNEVTEQSGFGPAPSPMDWQIHQLKCRYVLSISVLQAVGENLVVWSYHVCYQTPVLLWSKGLNEASCELVNG